jgi:hypothetical protein
MPRRDLTPGLHALVVGVSDYPGLLDREDKQAAPAEHLGLRKLRSAATTAHAVASWLVERKDRLAVPLASCRLLLSPSGHENALAGIAPSATLANFMAAAAAWRKDALGDAANFTLFYFAGHGLSRKRTNGQTLLFEEFAQGLKLLAGCVETSNLLEGMNAVSDDDTMARTQLYFYDACRTHPKEVDRYEQVFADTIWDPRPAAADKIYRDSRLTPAFYTPPGTQAFGLPGLGSVFSEALLRCLKGGAGVYDARGRRWLVTLNSLILAFNEQLRIVNAEYKTDQDSRISEIGKQALLHHLDGPPLVDVEITLAPQDKRAHARISVADEKDKKLFDLGAPFPDSHRNKLPAGSYAISSVPDVREPAAVAHKLCHQQAIPPYSEWPLFLE